MRTVTVFEWYKPEDYKGGPFSKREIGKAKFHAWGVDYEEFETGPANYSVAIVEMPDGEVRTLPVNMIKFDN